jgi:hypothetical protein
MRLHAQELTQPQSPSVKDLAQRMGIIQAQDYNMAKWAVGIRLKVGNDVIEEAFRRGEILRTHLMRPTWHFVSPHNLRWMRPISASSIIASMRSRDRDLELDNETYLQALRIIEDALTRSRRHLSRDELSDAINSCGIVTGYSRMIHFLMRAEAEGIVCSGAPNGKTQTYAIFDERVPSSSPVYPRDEALRRLAGIYFNSHGPATLRDFAWWSGLSLTDVRRAVADAELHTETIGLVEYVAAGCNCQDAAAGIRLLPAFDEYIIAYADRSAALPSLHYSRAISSNGVFRPVIIENGCVKGLWKKAAARNKQLRIITSLFPGIGIDDESEMQRAVEQCAAFFN